MASPDPNHPSSGRWTFVNSQGEEEDLDDGVSSTSSSSSSEFVKLDRDEVSFHHTTRDKSEPLSDSELFGAGEEGNVLPSEPMELELTAKVGDDTMVVRKSSQASDISDASLMEDTASGKSTSDICHSSEAVSAATLSSDDDSDLEILPTEGGIEAGKLGQVYGAEDSDVKVDSQQEKELTEFEGGALQGSTAQPPPLPDTGYTNPESGLSRQTSEECGVQCRLALLPRSLSVTDSDSDFSHLDSHSSADQSESEDVPDTTDNGTALSVHTGFSFVMHKACDAEGGDIQDAEGGGIQDAEGGDIKDAERGDVQDAEDGGIQDAKGGGIKDAERGDVQDAEGGGIKDAEGGGIQDAERGDVQDAEGGGIQDAERGDVQDAEGGDIQNGIQDQDEPDIVNHGEVRDIDDEGFGDHDVDQAVHHNEDRHSDDDENEDNAADTGTESGVEDDRIESDQSDGIPADDDDDLSFSNIGLENISLHEVNHTRQYIHEPNKFLSGTLSLVVIMAGWMALGLGIGHSIGSASQNVYVNSLQLNRKLHQTQDNLFRCIHRKGDVLSTLRRERREWDNQEDKLTKMWESRGETIWKLSTEVDGLKVKMNELQQSKADLELEVGRLRYQKHPGNNDKEVLAVGEAVANPRANTIYLGSRQSSAHELGKDRDLIVQNEDLETADLPKPSEEAGKSPADDSEQLGSDAMPTEEWENQTAKLKEELHLAQGRADMWQQLYLTERHRKPLAVNTTPDVLSCLTMLTPRVNFSEVVRAVNNSIVKSFMDFPNISQIKSYINDSLEGKRIFATVAEFQSLFEELSKLWMKWSINKTTGSTQPKWEYEEENNSRRQSDRSGDGQDQSDTKGYPWSENLRQFLNETQESVSRVSREIQQKWKEMKGLSEDLWKKHQPTISKWQNNLSQQISDIGSKIRERLQKKSSCWNKRREKRQLKKQHRQNMKDQEKKSKRRHIKPEKNRRQNKHFAEKTGRAKARSKSFKKALKKLFKKTKRLNWKSYKRLGQNGIRRVVDDFDHFLGVYGKHLSNVDGDLWVRCQLDWWQSQLVKKPPAMDNCRQSLFKWQKRLEKKDKHWRKENERKERMHQAKAVRRHEREGKHREDKSRFSQRKERHADREVKFAGTKRRKYSQEEPDDQRKSQRMMLEKDGWEGSEARNATENGKLAVSGEWFFKPPRCRGHYDQDSWYLRKMQQRETQRKSERRAPDGRWVFQRADDRDFHRQRPDDWFFARSQGRRRESYPNGDKYAYYENDKDNGDNYAYHNSCEFFFCY